MIKLSDYQTQTAIPTEMRTAERIALSYAFDNQKKKYIERMKCVHVWAVLECVDDNKLDFLATESRVPFYNSNLEPDIKRKMIRNSIYWYMKLGTRQAMEEMIETVFGRGKAFVEEWYTYGGEPFHFRIAAGTEVEQESIQEFLAYVNKVKNARSRLDYFIFQGVGNLIMKNETEVFCVSCEPCAESCLCGTVPDCGL